MKNKKRLILSVISFIFGGGIFGIVILFGLVGSLLCGKPFYIINGSNGPIPSCTSIFNTDFIWPFILGIVLLIIGIVFLIAHKRGNKK